MKKRVKKRENLFGRKRVVVHITKLGRTKTIKSTDTGSVYCTVRLYTAPVPAAVGTMKNGFLHAVFLGFKYTYNVF
jgi:hypothetical protein